MTSFDDDSDLPEDARVAQTLKLLEGQPDPGPDGSIGILVPRVILEDHLLHLGWPHTADAERKPALPIVDELLERLVESGLPQYTDGPEALFDPVDALNLHRTLARDGGDMIWFAFLERLRTEIGERGPAEGEEASPWLLQAVSFHSPIDVQCSIKRTRYRTEGSDTVRISVPVPGAHPSQENAAVEIVGTSHPILDRKELGSSILLTLDAKNSDEAWVELHYRLRSLLTDSLGAESGALTSQGGSAVSDPLAGNSESAALFGPPTEYLVSVAKNAAPDRSDPQVAAKQLFQFCFRWLSAGEVYVSALDSGDPLRDLVSKGWFSPLTGSALLSALANALEIPSRVVHGLHLIPSFPRWTSWTELQLPGIGWVPCDLFSSWELASGDMQSEWWASRMFGKLDRRLRFSELPAFAPLEEADPRTPLVLYHSDTEATFATHYLAGGAPLGRDRIAISFPAGTQQHEGLTQRLLGFLRRG